MVLICSRAKLIWLFVFLVLFMGCLETVSEGDGSTMFRPDLKNRLVDESLSFPLNQIWAYETGGNIYSTPAVYGGRVYFGSNDGMVYSLDKKGELIWRYPTKLFVTSSPAVIDEVVYVGSWDKNFYAIDALNGRLLWKVEIGGA